MSEWISVDFGHCYVAIFYLFDLDCRTVVIEQPSHSCKLCGKSFWNRDSMYKHMNMHKGTTQCPVCHKVLSRTTHMKRHLKNRHGWLGFGSTADAARNSINPLSLSTNPLSISSNPLAISTPRQTQQNQNTNASANTNTNANANSNLESSATFTTIRIRESSVERITSSPIP